MKTKPNRRHFIKSSFTATVGFGMLNNELSWAKEFKDSGKRIGIIGLDTSHCVAFTKEFNAPEPDPKLRGYRVIAAYPRGSYEIESSYSRIPRYTKEMEELGVEIVDSIDELLKIVDVVLLETNDGRLHLEQAIPVLEAGKTMFIDKPMTASLSDAIIIFNNARKLNVPVFSSSSLRYTENAQSVANGKIGRVIGASTYSPCKLEPTHPDLFWYGIHGVEMLYTVMGTGCQSVSRLHNADVDIVSGKWDDNRIGTFRGTRTGKGGYGGTAFGENGIMDLGPYGGYKPLLLEIASFFDTGVSPINENDTLEILAFMEAADESKRSNGEVIPLDKIFEQARKIAESSTKK